MYQNADTDIIDVILEQQTGSTEPIIYEETKKCPFNDYMPGMTENALLFLEEKKWRSAMRGVINKMALRFGTYNQAILENTLSIVSDNVIHEAYAKYEQLYNSSVELEKYKAYMNRKKAGRGRKYDILEIISTTDKAKHEFMVALYKCGEYQKKHYKERVPLSEIVLTEAVNGEEEEKRCWSVIGRYYNIVDKRNRIGEKTVDLRMKEREIQKRHRDMAKTTALLLEKRKNQDKRKLWSEICAQMPSYVAFCDELGTNFYWKGCFKGATRSVIIAANDAFYLEYLIAVTMMRNKKNEEKKVV